MRFARILRPPVKVNGKRIKVRLEDKCTISSVSSSPLENFTVKGFDVFGLMAGEKILAHFHLHSTRYFILRRIESDFSAGVKRLGIQARDKPEIDSWRRTQFSDSWLPDQKEKAEKNFPRPLRQVMVTLWTTGRHYSITVNS